MHKKAIWAAVGRVLAAGLLASVILTGFHSVYRCLPLCVVATDGASDFKYEPNTWYTNQTEGFSTGRTNNDGYMDAFDYTPGMPIKVLIMGASNMEATAVDMDQSTAARLNTMLGEKTVYNIGISMHSLITCFTNLPAALEKYRPASYVVFEATSLTYPAQELRDALDGTTVEMALQDNKLKKNPFLRSMYSKLQNLWTDRIQPLFAAPPDDADTGTAGSDDAEAAQQLLDEVLARAARQLAAAGVQGIVFYHPPTTLDRDGHLILGTAEDEKNKAELAALCAKNGLIFLDLSDRFRAEYAAAHILPHGFANSSVGSGHLNSDGHRMLAEELYRVMEGGAA